MHEIQLKNMVCPRCIMAVENVLEELSMPYEKVELGKVILKTAVDQSEYDGFEIRINKLGFQILKDKESQKIEVIKNLFDTLLQKDEIPPGFNVSSYIKAHMPEDYSSLSHLFSTMEGITIEKYFIKIKIEKVKEWIFYQEMNLSEMAYKLDYSSVQHLSSQFKKNTGMTPSQYKKLRIGAGSNS